MTTRTEVLRDGTIGGEEPLGVTRGLEPLHAPLPLAGRLVRVLGAIIEIAVLAMFHPGENLALGGSVALEFVGDDHARHVGQALEELAEELLRGLLVPPALHQDIEHVPVLIHRPPQIVTFAFDGQKHLIQVPLVPGPGTSATELIGILLAKLAAPLADGFVGHDDPTFKQQLFHIAKAQAEPKVQPHGVADDLDRKAVILIAVGRLVCSCGEYATPGRTCTGCSTS